MSDGWIGMLNEHGIPPYFSASYPKSRGENKREWTPNVYKMSPTGVESSQEKKKPVASQLPAFTISTEEVDGHLTASDCSELSRAKKADELFMFWSSHTPRQK